jgi:hypothetical protein
MVYSDPRPGRWILPLMIVGMVVLTYTFVNSLEPAEGPTGAPADPAFTTDPSQPGVTLPPALQQFMVTLDIFESQLNTFANEVAQTNSRWDNRDTTGQTFAETRTQFIQLQTQLRNFETDVTQAPNVPAELAAGHVELMVEVGHLHLKVQEIIVGLDAPDDGTARRTAVAEFQVEAEQVLDVIASIRRTAHGEPDPTTTTTTEDDTTDTTGGEGDTETTTTTIVDG